jgi:hypothetical protein
MLSFCGLNTDITFEIRLRSGRVFALSGLLFGAIVILSACGDSSNFTPRGSNAPSSSGAAGEGSDSAGVRIAPMTAPPDANARPPLPGQTGRERDSQGLPMLKPAKGLNSSVMLFNEPVRNQDQRFDRVENAVQELRNDFDAMLPSLLRLVAIEKDIANLVVQLETLMSDDYYASAAANNAAIAPAAGVEQEPLALVNPAPVSAEPPQQQPDLATAVTQVATEIVPPQPQKEQQPKPLAVASLSTSGSVTASGLRIGAHPDYTRLVIDISGKTDFSVDIDNSEKILLIQMPDVQWGGAPSSAAVNGVVKSWSANAGAGGQGSLLSVSLNKAASIKSRQILDSPPRVVIDLSH